VAKDTEASMFEGLRGIGRHRFDIEAGHVSDAEQVIALRKGNGSEGTVSGIARLFLR
jgi:hypothetical protein